MEQIKKIWVFTDPARIPNQSAEEAFGPSPEAESTRFRLDSLHTVSPGTPVFSPCAALLAAVTAPAERLVFVMRPYAVDRGIGPIHYLIYRGIARASVLRDDGTLVDRNDSELADHLWKAHDAVRRYADQHPEHSAADRPSGGLLGIGVGEAPDGGTRPISDLFDLPHADFTPINVRGGLHLGATGSSGLSVEIIRDEPGPEPTIDELASDDPEVELEDTALFDAGEPTLTRLIARRARHQVLRRADLAALYGANSDRLWTRRLYTDGRPRPGDEATQIDRDQIHTDLLARFAHGARVWIDVRDHQAMPAGWSGSELPRISVSYNGGGAPVELGRVDWPWFVLEQDELPPPTALPSDGSGDLTLKLTLPGDWVGSGATGLLLSPWQTDARRRFQYTTSDPDAAKSPVLEVAIPVRAANGQLRPLSTLVQVMLGPTDGAGLPPGSQAATTLTVLRPLELLQGLDLDALNTGTAPTAEPQSEINTLLRRYRAPSGIIAPIGQKPVALASALMAAPKGVYLLMFPGAGEGRAAASADPGGASSRPLSERLSGLVGDATPTRLLARDRDGNVRLLNELMVCGLSRERILAPSGDGPTMIALTHSQVQSLDGLAVAGNLNPSLPVHLGIKRSPSVAEQHGDHIERFELVLIGWAGAGRAELREVPTSIRLETRSTEHRPLPPDPVEVPT